MAFRTLTGEIVGIPDWVTYENYDVEARAGHEISYEQLAPLMRDLLADRFKLKVHIETRVRPMYELRVLRADGKLGPQMRPAKADCEARPETCQTRFGEGLIDSSATSMASFVTALHIGRPVLTRQVSPANMNYSSNTHRRTPAICRLSRRPCANSLD